MVRKDRCARPQLPETAATPAEPQSKGDVPPMESDCLSDRTGQAAAAWLARELQVLKSASGLSFAQISKRTHYAKSSWERWVNGKMLPPRSAVETFASVTEGNGEVLLELWDLATQQHQAVTEAPESVREPVAEASIAPPVMGAVGVWRSLMQPVLDLVSDMTDALSTGVGEGTCLVVEFRRAQPDVFGWRGSLSLSRVTPESRRGSAVEHKACESRVDAAAAVAPVPC
ncbi:helix-turn-helix domain-containing protein [Streptacidiphilus sp. EB129]|uniref:helix-turn-helix domain-containing protein n=1 Tax=Streptacidiphilus sp. EB129 TaxID=3156262 RepID=UPI0035167A76